MGKVIFLNQQAKEFHEQNGIKIQNPPELRLIQGYKKESLSPRKIKAKKPKRQTIGQRIFESLQDKDPNGIA